LVQIGSPPLACKSGIANVSIYHFHLVDAAESEDVLELHVMRSKERLQAGGSGQGS
jgi:hypothetical protein